jgi:phospholipase/lecithinase/hemolysin
VAAAFGLAFPQCPGSVTNPTSQMLASVGAHVADVEAKVQQFQSGDTFVPATLVTILVGQYDVIDAFNAVVSGTLTRTDAMTQVGALGKRLSAVVNGVAHGGTGARVVYSTIPDLTLSPWGRALSSDNQALLSALTANFNTEFRASVVNDGRYVGLILAEGELTNVTSNPGTYGVTEVASPACTATLPNCSTATLQSTAASSSTYYLWADGTRPGPAFQTHFGAVAASRATNNPF